MAVQKTISIVINKGSVKLDLADDAIERLTELKGVQIDRYYRFDNIDRDDHHLVQVVNELGKEMSCWIGTLKVIEIPADVKWEISTHNGYEQINDRDQVGGIFRTWV